MFEKPVRSSIGSKRPVRHPLPWAHVLKRYDNGLEKNGIGCSLCAAACPSDAIFVEASGKNTDEKNRFFAGER